MKKIHVSRCDLIVDIPGQVKLYSIWVSEDIVEILADAVYECTAKIIEGDNSSTFVPAEIYRGRRKTAIDGSVIGPYYFLAIFVDANAGDTSVSEVILPDVLRPALKARAKDIIGTQVR